MSSVRSRMRSRTSRVVALALVASSLAVVGVGQATQAQALPGRRLCMYVDGELDGDLWRFVVVNYKKRGKCPYINPQKYPNLITMTNPVPKRTCEEVSGFVAYGDDICRVLEKDTVYELYFNMNDKMPARRYHKGHVGQFR